MTFSPSPISRMALVLLGIACAAVCYGGWELYARAASAAQAASNYADCAGLARKIEALRKSPRKAVFDLAAQGDGTSLLGKAAADMDVKPASIREIRAGAEERAGDNSPYVRQETLVRLGPLPPELLFRLWYRLGELDPSLVISSIRLSTPNRREGAWDGDRWASEFTLTQLQYAPISPSPPRPAR